MFTGHWRACGSHMHRLLHLLLKHAHSNLSTTQVAASSAFPRAQIQNMHSSHDGGPPLAF